MNSSATADFAVASYIAHLDWRPEVQGMFVFMCITLTHRSCGLRLA